jgi:hypothetical protein
MAGAHAPLAVLVAACSHLSRRRSIMTQTQASQFAHKPHLMLTPHMALAAGLPGWPAHISKTAGQPLLI